jgi:hypothetical protein
MESSKKIPLGQIAWPEHIKFDRVSKTLWNEGPGDEDL